MPKKRDFQYHFDGNQPSPPKKYRGTYCVFDAGTTWCNGHSQSDGHTASSLHPDSLPVPCRSALQLLKFISFNVIQYGFIFTKLSENQEWDILSKPRKYHLTKPTLGFCAKVVIVGNLFYIIFGFLNKTFLF